jgi:hypothetical protein
MLEMGIDETCGRELRRDTNETNHLAFKAIYITNPMKTF